MASSLAAARRYFTGWLLRGTSASGAGRQQPGIPVFLTSSLVRRLSCIMRVAAAAARRKPDGLTSKRRVKSAGLSCRVPWAREGRADRATSRRRCSVRPESARAIDEATRRPAGRELFGNSARHSGSGAPGEMVTVAVRAGDGVARVEVTNRSGPGVPEVRPAGRDAERGRGLQLVAGLAARWGWRWRGGRTVTWFELSHG